MLVSKDQFLHFANRYKHICEEQDAFHEALRPYFDAPVCNYLQNAVDGYVELLVTIAECEEEDDIFYWWAHENADKVINVQEVSTGEQRSFNVETAEGLYEYLYYMYNT